VPIRVSKPGDLNVGDYFESCSFHPCVITNIDSTGVQIEGVSLVDNGTQHCNVRHCGIRSLTEQEARQWKQAGPADLELPMGERWWHHK